MIQTGSLHERRRSRLLLFHGHLVLVEDAFETTQIKTKILRSPEWQHQEFYKGANTGLRNKDQWQNSSSISGRSSHSLGPSQILIRKLCIILRKLSPSWTCQNSFYSFTVHSTARWNCLTKAREERLLTLLAHKTARLVLLALLFLHVCFFVLFMSSDVPLCNSIIPQWIPPSDTRYHQICRNEKNRPTWRDEENNHSLLSKY